MSPPSDPAPKRVSPHRPTFPQRVAAALVSRLIRTTAWSQRFVLDDPHGSLPQAHHQPAIYAIWHNRLAFSLIIHQRFVRPAAGGRRLAAMVSTSRDGALLSAVLEAFDVQPVRGSSSRRGAQALVELRSWAQRGLDLAITPDGPRGPRYVVQPGVLALAHVSRLPIVPVGYHLSRKITLRSWDRFQVPLPFGRCTLSLGPILHVQEGSPEALEAARLDLQQRLVALTRD